MKLLYDMPDDVNRLLSIYKVENDQKNKSDALTHLIRKKLGKKSEK